MGEVISINEQLQARQATREAEQKLLKVIGKMDVCDLLHLPKQKRMILYYLIDGKCPGLTMHWF